MEESLHFDGWLKGVVRHFNGLSSVDQTQTLTELLGCCDGQLIWDLQQKLPDFLYRDFIQLLPPEVTEKILRYLSPSTLLTACSVSSLWNKNISGMNQLWRKQCNLVGYNISSDVGDYKASCVEGLRLRGLLREGRGWKQDTLVDLVKPPGRFSALHHHQGHIAGGTADSSHTLTIEDTGESVVIWSVQSDRVIVSFPVSGSVSCIKLSYPALVVCGHFDGTLSSHQVSGLAGGSDDPAPPGHLLQKYRLHTAPVLSLDFDIGEDILVSGSADCSTKVWCLSSGGLLRTLPSQSHWVLSVIFSSHLNQTIPVYAGRNILLIMTRDDIQLYTWQPEISTTDSMVSSLSLQDKPASSASSGGGLKLKDVTHRDLYIPLKTVTDAVHSFFFTPGLHFDGEHISFVRQMPMFDSQTIGDADIVTINAGNGKVTQSVHINQKIRKLLAIGSRFAVLLLPYVDSKYKNLAIVDLQRREVVGGCTVPHSRASTPDFSQVGIGDISWLNGFSTSSTKGLVACLALADSTIQTVVWDVKKKEESLADAAGVSSGVTSMFRCKPFW